MFPTKCQVQNDHTHWDNNILCVCQHLDFTLYVIIETYMFKFRQFFRFLCLNNSFYRSYVPCLYNISNISYIYIYFIYPPIYHIYIYIYIFYIFNTFNTFCRQIIYFGLLFVIFPMHSLFLSPYLWTSQCIFLGFLVPGETRSIRNRAFLYFLEFPGISFKPDEHCTF